jgi:hypothetical protein
MRAVLLDIEQSDAFDGQVWDFDPFGRKIGEWTAEEVSYNLLLLIDAGFVLGSRDQSGVFAICRLTHDGHEFLDTIRDDGVWAKAKAGAKAVGGGALGLIWDLGKLVIREEAKKHLGL